MKAADLMVKALENEGVEYVFGIPGEENLDLLESLSNSSIELVLTRHEQAAGFMAATYGRLTGKPGVCLSTLGPGATNLVTSVAYAQLGAMPMVVITGQKPIKDRPQGQFQIIDVIDMMTPITKYTQPIISAKTIPSHVREAFRRAEDERPGAAHLELSDDIAAEEVDATPIAPSYSRRPITEHKSVDYVLKLLKEAKHPLIVIGAAANRKITAKMLRAFVDKTGIPFITTQMGKGVINEDHPRWLGNAAVSDGDYPHRAIEQADLILNVGHDVVEKPPFMMKPDQRKVVHINFQGAQVDSVYFPHASMIGDIGNSIWQLKEGIEPQSHWDFEFMLKVREHMRDHTDEGAHDEAFPMLPQRLVEEVREVMPDDGIIALDNGIYKIWFARNYPARQPNTVLLDNALASMGAGLPSAMAAKLVHPNRKVVSICGDGGFMMNSQEIETAVRMNLDLVVLILNDSAYGMIKWKQEHMGLHDFGLDFKNPDFIKYAEAYGAKGYRLAATEELQPLMRDCMEQGGVHIIDVPVDYSRNVELLNEEIPKRAKAIQA
ncbi:MULTISPECIES: acetolactate synthase large subunit [unclassified Idiomarina]|uniref:acetolactate synthase large subunit n=1 Tax=unclassified Idiomarina TaxID=2614829 RepID=UPI000C93ACD1|nr:MULTISPECIES: acetolactate synthase large subunit [unclassified Idiomarina]MAD53697.1 acetolactate synthase large subunit [Idiomarinaceae bacterium]MEC7643608.1 acetolactate synthase large subunit [Pseudomonadota bacterium]NQZ02972.1 acetolactate synthase large subunit [Idiomarina sp.]